MARFKTYKTKKGVRFLAEVRRTEGGVEIFKDSKSFSTKTAAKSWATKVEEKIEEGGSQAIMAMKSSGYTFGKLVEKYLEEIPKMKPFGPEKTRVLGKVNDYELGAVPATLLRPQHLIDYCRKRVVVDGVKPQTALHEFSTYRSVAAVAQLWGVDLDTRPFQDAKPMLDKLGLVAPSEKRDRKLEKHEFNMILEELKRRDADYRSKLPMRDLFIFSLQTALRQSKVTEILWDDFDKDRKQLYVRNLKDPRVKGKAKWLPLTKTAIEIIEKQPRTSPEIFPYNPKSIKESFRHVCKKLKIEGLVWHDLRAALASILFDEGWSVEEIANITLHNDIKILREVYIRSDMSTKVRQMLDDREGSLEWFNG